MNECLKQFLPPVQRWFRARYGTPTPPQELGWPAIQRGEHVLILSPTGSGKTMAAFLWGLNTIFAGLQQDPTLSGVQLLYISPLRALNNDIERNLREPLAGIRHTAHELGHDLPPLRVAVRTGDTPSSARQQQVRHPPQVLITTPESLYLLLTSPRAREGLRNVRTVIVDEIHTLCGNKRGVHLALSLERLTRLTPTPPQRIGLSATQRPLDEVARFLVGQEWEADEQGQERLLSRAVTIVDAGARKDLALEVVTVVPDLRHLPGDSIWPSLIPDVLQEVRRHHTTLIFTNSRRSAERAADRLNEQYALEEAEEVAPGSTAALLEGGRPKGEGMFGTGRVGGPFRAHHGSISKEARLEMETALKAGKLPALIGTSSLELGIDIGSVDEVVQLQSPRSVARGLQRVGRSGHLVGQTSVGRIYATFREDLLDAGAVAHGMLHGDIEPTYTPRNCLDVLSQQIVALVAGEDWPVASIYRLVRQAYGYQELSERAFAAVLEMLSGHYPSATFRELRPRLSWDRVHDTLAALPGTRLLALSNAGTIPDRGLFRVLLADGKTVLGTLDEEFVYETQVGDTFTLGSNTWRALKIDEDKIIVGDAAGKMPRMPFWRGDAPRRDYDTGLRLGEFRRLLSERVAALPTLPDDPAAEWPAEAAPVIAWLREEYAMDDSSARNAILYVRHQWEVMGAISSDKTIIVETFSDALGDPRLAVHSCFGGRVNSAWALVLAQVLREQLKVQVETQVNDDGILFRFLEADREPPTDIVRLVGPEEARERLLLELPNAALFGAQFRMNAARALLLPGARGSHRTPFWLQRMRAKDLLAAVKGLADFPIVAETYRDCLNDVLDLPHLMDVLGAIGAGEIRVVEAETLVPSPVTGSLLFDFMAIQMYEGDLPKAERQMQALAVNRELLSQLLTEGTLPDLLRPEAFAAVEDELQHLAESYRARSMEELAVLLHDLGDLDAEEIAARALGEGRAWLLQLAAAGRAFQVEIPTRAGIAPRWIAAEDYRRYRDAFALAEQPPLPLPPALLEPHLAPEEAREAILHVLTRTHGPLSREDLLARYELPSPWLEETLERLVETGYLVYGHLSPGAAQAQWCDRRVLERIHRRTLSLLRQEVRPVDLPAYADFLARWQGVHPAHRHHASVGLRDALQQLRGLAAPASLWERDLLALRVEGLRAALFAPLCESGDLVWALSGAEARRARLRFLFRGEGALYLGAVATAEGLSETARRLWEMLQSEGACYTEDLQRGLNLATAALEAGLSELALAGIITNDRLEPLHQLLRGAGGPPDAAHGLKSSLDATLDAWRTARGGSEASPLRRPSALRLREARRQATHHPLATPRWSGRWSLVHSRAVRGSELSGDERSLRLARLLLQRYGIVTRESLLNEDEAWEWPAIYRQFELLEMRGEARRGYFVRGLPGVQFALPEAVDRLRAWDSADADGAEALVLLNACDPANLYGSALSAARLEAGEVAAEEPTTDTGTPLVGGPLRFARLPSNYVVLRRGVPVLLYEHGGGRWTTLPQAEEDTLREAVRLVIAHLTREGGLASQPRRVLVSLWNGAPPLGTPAQTLLEPLGFRREPPALVWDGG
jgi:ATP-dependent Lhr-like helicase